MVLSLGGSAQVGGGMEQALFTVGDEAVVDLALRGPTAIAQVSSYLVQVEQVFERVGGFVQPEDGGRLAPRVLGATGDVDPTVRPRLDAPAGVRERALGKFVVFPFHEMTSPFWASSSSRKGPGPDASSE